jgi:hypothetical protein
MILMRFSFRNARKTDEYSFALLQSKHINFMPIWRASCGGYFVRVLEFYLIVLLIFDQILPTVAPFEVVGVRR